MRSAKIALSMLLALSTFFPMGADGSAPPNPDIVTVTMDSTENTVVPQESSPTFFKQHGVAHWSTASSPGSYVQVELKMWIVGLELHADLLPDPVIMTRSENEAGFDISILIPAGSIARTTNYTLYGYWNYVAYPAEKFEIDPIDMELNIAPYSYIVFRDMVYDTEGGPETVPKGKWTSVDLSLWNMGNADDVYEISVMHSDSVKVRYATSSLSVPRDQFVRFELDVYPVDAREAEVTVKVTPQFGMTNCSGEIHFTLYVDTTSNYISRNFLQYVGIGALVIFLVALLVLMLYLFKRRDRSRRLPRGHG